MSKSSDFPIVHARNIPFGTSTESLYELFSKHGSLNQIRISNQDNKNDCFVIYNNLSIAKRIVKELNGINFNGRYLILSLYAIDKSKLTDDDITASGDVEYKLRLDELNKLKQQHNIT
ncbi:hypothetical protein DFJ63DRAFT_239377 [Scheffersomyces coipomensis]|uniref:uncharacterized protein n=1 Tax=Scheffersomyces coipomensis TaxID=1788519 RepID=UPI00315CB591